MPDPEATSPPPGKHAPGPVREEYIDTRDGLRTLLNKLSQLPVWAFDTEFVGEETYIPRLCLVQVATPDTLYLVDPLAVDDIASFWKLVAEPGRRVVVHGGREEIRLCRQWAGVPPSGLFDVQVAAGLTGPVFPLGMGTLAEQELGVRLRKGETLTEWRTRPLSPEQITYAYDDVRYLLPLEKILSGRLADHHRQAWMEEETSRQINSVDPVRIQEDERWRKLKGAGSLDPKRLGVLRALHAWREGRANELNRPVRVLMRDDLLVELARRMPTRPADLELVRGISKRDVPVLVEVIEQARNLPRDQWPEATPRELEAPQAQPLVSFLQLVLQHHCARVNLAQPLAATQAELKTLVRQHLTGEAQPSEGLLSAGWRREHILPLLQDALAGRLALRVQDITRDEPLGW